MSSESQVELTQAYVDLLEAYGRSIGIEDIKVSPDGSKFEIEDVTIVVQHDPAFGRIAMMSEIGTIDPERRGEVAPKLLTMNLALALKGGHALAADYESGTAHLTHGLPLAGLTTERFDAELAAMIAKVRAAKKVLEAERSAANEAARAALAEASDTVMRV